jgi:hypothetical protein
MVHAKVKEEIKTQSLCLISFFKNRANHENVEKYCLKGKFCGKYMDQ